MTFTELLYFMLSLVKESSQTALERAFPRLQKEHLHMTQQAFSAARQKIRWEAVEELHGATVEGSYHEPWETWLGYRLLAIDGTSIQLPADKQLLAYYGGLGPEKTSPAALGSILYDLRNDIIVDAKLAPLSGNERDLAKEHLQALTKLESFKGGHQELVIFDRGYASGDLIISLQDKELKYVMRLERKVCPEIDRQEARDGWALFGAEKLRVRAIKFTLSTGEEETLITNLTEGEMGTEVFPELYHQRWKIETKYDQVKKKLEIENFSGRLEDNIKQDFYGMMTVANLLASVMREANREAKGEREGKGNLHKYQVNVNHAIGVYKDRLIGVMVAKDEISRGYLLRELVKAIKRSVVPLRPNRQVSRKACPRKARFHHNHKSNC
jgi:hypothetical protein